MGFLKHFRVFQRRLKMFQCRFRESKGIKEEFRFGEFQGRSRGYQGALSGLLMFQVVLKGYGNFKTLEGVGIRTPELIPEGATGSQ